MKTLMIGLICLFAATVEAQEFEALIAAAMDHYDAKEYSASAQKYDSAFAIDIGHSGQYYNAACSSALAGNKEQAMIYLKQAAARGWKNLEHTKKDSDLAALYEDKDWENVLAIIKVNHNEYEAKLNQPLKKQLEEIGIRDQTLRSLISEAQKKFGKESKEMEYFSSQIARQDSLNQFEVSQIIEENGWPGKSVVGWLGNMNVWLVVQHATLDYQEKYIPLLEASVAEEESEGNHLALLVDRILKNKGEPQIYGSQLVPDADGKPMVYKIKDPEYVNQRRHEIGLGPIENYIKRWGVEWTIEQKEK